MFRLTLRGQGCSAPSRWVSVFLGSLTAMIAFAATTVDAAPRLNPEHVLREWAKASRGIVAVGKSAQQRAFLEYASNYNGHQIALMNEFRGPVDADELLKRYRFTEVKQTENIFRLSAVPRDDVEGLFVTGFEVVFSDDSYLPISVQFVDEEGEELGESLALLTSKPEQVVEVFDRTAVKREQSGVRVASAVENPDAGGVKQADVEFSVKQGKDSKRLQEVLNKWKSQALRTKTMRATFSRFVYDHTFHEERRAHGTLAFRAPDKAVIESEPMKDSTRTTSQMSDQHGNRYKVKNDGKAEQWIWWNNHCCHISHESKVIDVYTKSPKPTKTRQASFWGNFSQFYFSVYEQMLPAFNTWSPYLETDFEWSISKETPSVLHLKGTPQTEKMRGNLSELSVMLDVETFRVRAVKTVDPGANSETVYVVRDVLINVDDDAVEFVDPVRFEVPELPGYRTIKHGR